MVLVADHGWSYFAALPVVATLCFGVGLLIGLPASRIRGSYLAIVTLAMAYVFPELVVRFESLTGGSNGKGPVRGEARLIPPSWVPIADAGRLARPLWVFCLLVVIAAVMFLLARNGIRVDPAGRSWRCATTRPSARASGIDVVRYKAVAFAFSAAYGGIAGAMLMMNRPFASDVQFGTGWRSSWWSASSSAAPARSPAPSPGAIAYVFVPYFVSGWAIDSAACRPASGRSPSRCSTGCDRRAARRPASSSGCCSCPGVLLPGRARRRLRRAAGQRDHDRAEPAVDGRRQPASCRRDAAGSAQPQHVAGAGLQHRRYTR